MSRKDIYAGFGRLTVSRCVVPPSCAADNGRLGAHRDRLHYPCSALVQRPRNQAPVGAERQRARQSFKADRQCSELTVCSTSGQGSTCPDPTNTSNASISHPSKNRHPVLLFSTPKSADSTFAAIIYISPARHRYDLALNALALGRSIKWRRISE